MYDAIRAVDSNHVIMFEACGNIQVPTAGAVFPRFPYPTWPGIPGEGISARDDRSWPIAGTNIAYSFHSYVPFNYTHHKPPVDGTQEPTGTWPSWYTHPGTTERLYDREGLQEWYETSRAEQIDFARQFPTVVGEFGAVSNPGQENYAADATDWFNDEGWGWLWFAWRSL